MEKDQGYLSGKKNNTIVQEMETVINDFNRWVRKETASLVKQDSNSFRGTVNAGVDQRTGTD